MKRMFFKLVKWLLSYIVMFIVVTIIAHFFGYRIDKRETFKNQLENKGIALVDIKPPVSVTQEYPNVEGISYRESLDLSKGPALMIWKEDEQPFWVGIRSALKDRNYKSPILFLDFDGKVEVRVDKEASTGWVEMDSNHSYYIKFKEDIHPLTGIRIPPLFVKFPKEDIYFIRYTISGDDAVPTQGIFAINVHSKIVVKK